MIGRAFSSKARKFLALQSLFYAFANSIEALVPLLLAPILTRMLDPTGYGVWVLFVTYATFMRPVVGLTIQDAIRMRFYDFDQDKLDRFTHTALFVMLALALFVGALTLLFDDVLTVATKFPKAWLISIVGAAFLYEVFYTVLALHQFHNHRKAFLATQVTQALLSMIFIVAFLLSGWDWRGVVLGRMLGMALAILFSLRTLGFTPRKLWRVPERMFYGNIASFGFLYWPAGAVVMVMGTADKVIAAHYAGVEASALYGVAALFASAFWLVDYSFVMAWTPWLFRRLSSESEDGLGAVASVSLLYFVGAALAGAAFYLVARLAAPIILGAAFHSAIPLLAYIIPAVVLQGYYTHNMKFLHFQKRIGLMSVLAVTTIALNIVLSIVWAKTMGIAGIMLATGVSFATTFLISGAIILAHFLARQKGSQALAQR